MDAEREADLIDVNRAIITCVRGGMKMSRATLYRRMADSGFPEPVAFRWPKRFWSKAAVEAWLSDQQTIRKIRTLDERSMRIWISVNIKSGMGQSATERERQRLFALWAHGDWSHIPGRLATIAGCHVAAEQYLFTVGVETPKCLAVCAMLAPFACLHATTSDGFAAFGLPRLSFPRCVIPVAVSDARAASRPASQRDFYFHSLHIGDLGENCEDQFPDSTPDLPQPNHIRCDAFLE